ncbi:MAG TPA: hypothetical protein VJQ54_15860 [Candidatus Sulfotelmatobacter sp.]|nr:hypothetical protein [Candidatus Sulfotelmatobacter sp.]
MEGRSCIQRAGFAISAIMICLALMCGATLTPPTPSVETRAKPGQALAIVVNHANPVDSLSFGELRKVFLGERNHWPNGRRVALAMLDYGQPERQTVLRLIYRMDENGYQDHLLRGMFRGSVFVAPKTLSSPEILRKFVFNAPGGIGYLRASDVDSSVKVLRIDGLLPEDKNYRLQIDEPSPK